MRTQTPSKWLAIEPDVAKVAGMVGNSTQVLLKHYKAVKTRMEAEKFWGLKLMPA